MDCSYWAVMHLIVCFLFGDLWGLFPGFKSDQHEIFKLELWGLRLFGEVQTKYAVFNPNKSPTGVNYWALAIRTIISRCRFAINLVSCLILPV